MRKAVSTRVLTAGLAARCLLALSACGDNDESVGTDGLPPAPEETTSAPVEPTTEAPTATPTTAAPSASATPSVRQIVIDVKGGKATGDTGLIEVGVDEPFQVVVTSDVAEEVHVHSETRAGFSGDVEAGGTVTVDAVVKNPGRYEIEFEESGLVLARLQVT